MTTLATKPVLSTPPGVSLIVATIGRIDELRRLLDSLVQQTMQNFEVILVDQSLSDGVGNLIGHYDDKMQIHHLPDSRRGLSRARNLGLAQAAANICGFPDDDCWYGNDVLESVVQFFEERPEFGLLSGIYTEPGKVNASFPSVPKMLTAANCPSRSASVGLFVKRSELASICLIFDERIGAGTRLQVGEEVEFVMRCLLAGVHGFYEPSLIVYHAIARDARNSRESKLLDTEAFWYIVGKNYGPIRGASRLLLSLAKCVVSPSTSGVGQRLSAMFRGYRLGRRFRRQ